MASAQSRAEEAGPRATLAARLSALSLSTWHTRGSSDVGYPALQPATLALHREGRLLRSTPESPGSSTPCQHAGLSAAASLDEREPLLAAQHTDSAASESTASDADEQHLDGLADMPVSFRSAARSEVQPWLRWLQDTLPFMLLLLTVFLQRHFLGILAFAWFSTVLHHANVRMREHISSQTTSLAMPLLISALISSQMLMLGILSGKDIWLQLLLKLPEWGHEMPTVFEVLWTVLATDMMARLALMLLKLELLLVLSQRAGRLSTLRRAFSLIELSGMLYRAALPMPQWYNWLQQAVQGRLFATFVSGLYLALKMTLLLERGRAAVLAFKALLLQQVQIGKYASAEELAESGEEACAICQEAMRAPIVLEECGHLFCEECILSWCERAPEAPTCPLCRKPVLCAETSQHSDGTTSLLPQMF